MLCRYCRGECRAYGTRSVNNGRDVKRYRRCGNCQRKLRTIEVELTPLVTEAMEMIGKFFAA
ncbi:MAG: hypothetical protein VW405_02315 [Rhodospirillaceae bacterium]